MKALSNIRVIDLTHVIAGPFCTYQLAVMGADVIKIESPDNPDMVRASSSKQPIGKDGLGPMYTSQNANKRAITLDLRQEQGKKILTELIATADVLVENYRSGALGKLGFGYDEVCQIKPDIIYCSMTGYGQDGPKGEHTAYDNVIQAYSGLMACTGQDNNSPTKVGPPVLDYSTGIQAAYAIMTALFDRTRTGQGQYIDIAMLDSALMLMSANIRYYAQTDRLFPVSGNNSAVNAGYCCYPTQTGLLMLGAFTGEQVKNMWHILGDEEHGNKLSTLLPPEMIDHIHQDQARIEAMLKTDTAENWEAIFNANRVPAARVRSLDETLKESQLASRSVLQSIDGESDHSVYPVASFKFKSNGPQLNRPPPEFSQHTHEILEELNYQDEDIQSFIEEGVVAPYDNI